MAEGLSEVGNVVNVYIWLLFLASWPSYERLEAGTAEDSQIPTESWGITGLWLLIVYTLTRNKVIIVFLLLVVYLWNVA